MVIRWWIAKLGDVRSAGCTLKWLAWIGVPSMALGAAVVSQWPHEVAARAQVLPAAPASSHGAPAPRVDPEDSTGTDDAEARFRLRGSIEALDPSGAGCLEAGTCLQVAGFESRQGAGMLVWWYGEVPESAREAAGAEPSVEVRFEVAPYSQQQIIDGVGRLIDAVYEQRLPGVEKAKVYSFTESHRGEGVTVAVDKSLLGNKAELERAMSALAGLPVTVKRGSQIASLVAGA